MILFVEVRRQINIVTIITFLNKAKQIDMIVFIAVVTFKGIAFISFIFKARVGNRFIT